MPNLAPTQAVSLQAVIYVRVSKDVSGKGRSVEEQIDECRRTCERNGWPVREVVQDNDVSASVNSRKKRPGFQRLAEILRDGDVLVLWEQSRITRRTRELDDLIDLCEDRNVLFSAGGSIKNFDNVDDISNTKMQGIFDEAEARKTKKRTLRNARARAKAGEPHSALPYGYAKEFEPNGDYRWVIDGVRGPVVREIVNALLRGKPVKAIARDLNERKVPSPRRGDSPDVWSHNNIRDLALKKTYAGLRTLQGVVVSQGTWEPLITEDEHARLDAILKDPSRVKSRGPELKHLLTGIATCGVCGATVAHERESRGYPGCPPAYRCPRGHTRRDSAVIDALVERVIIEFFNDELLTRRVLAGGDEEVEKAMQEVREYRQILEVTYGQVARREITPAGLAGVEKHLLPLIEAAEVKARTAAVPPELKRLAEGGIWSDLSLAEKRAVIRKCVRIELTPKLGRKRYPTDPVTITPSAIFGDPTAAGLLDTDETK